MVAWLVGDFVRDFIDGFVDGWYAGLVVVGAIKGTTVAFNVGNTDIPPKRGGWVFGLRFVGISAVGLDDASIGWVDKMIVGMVFGLLVDSVIVGNNEYDILDGKKEWSANIGVNINATVVGVIVGVAVVGSEVGDFVVGVVVGVAVVGIEVGSVVVGVDVGGTVVGVIVGVAVVGSEVGDFVVGVVVGPDVGATVAGFAVGCWVVGDFVVGFVWVQLLVFDLLYWLAMGSAFSSDLSVRYSILF